MHHTNPRVDTRIKTKEPGPPLLLCSAARPPERVLTSESIHPGSVRPCSGPGGRVGRGAMVAAVLLLFSLTWPALRAQQQANGPRPGLNDPAQNYFSFPSDDLALIAPGNDGVTQIRSYTLNGTFNPAPDNPAPGPINYTQPADTDNFVAASGHIWAPDKEQTIYARRLNGTSQLDVVFLVPGSTFPKDASYIFNDFAPRLPVCADFMAIAVGDLDNLPDSAGHLHDEVVLAYAAQDAGSDSQMIKLAVLDYTAPATAPPAPVAVTSTPTLAAINPKSFSSKSSDLGILPIDNIIGLVLGDFDGDGRKEIAVAFLQDGRTLVIQIWRYSKDGQGRPSLTQVSQTQAAPSIIPRTQYVGTISLAAGNFTGNPKGADELLVATADWTAGYYLPDIYSERVFLSLWQADGNLQLTRKASLDRPADQIPGRDPAYSADFGNWGSRVRVQVAPGLFVYDPNNGFDLNRREFVVAWNLGCSGPALGKLGLVSFKVQGDQLVPLNELYFAAASGNGNIYQRFSLTAGAFLGNTSSPPSLWGIALNYWPDGGGYPTLSFLNSNIRVVDGIALTDTPLLPGDGLQRFPVVAADFSGKSVYLGAPVHFTIDNVMNTDFILQEPPKHAFYDNRPDSSTYGQVVTVSRYDDVNVALKTESGTSFSGKSTDSSDWTIGGSVAASAGATVSGGFPGVAKVQASVDVTGKISYEYNQNKSSYNSNYATRTLTETQIASRDDALVGRLQLFDVWRYRVYGATATSPNGDALNAFYEIVLPGPVLSARGGGLGYDWYQPVHENGNILSYPQPSGNTFRPPDLGPYQVPCPAKLESGQQCTDGKLSVTEPLIPDRQIKLGGTDQSLSIDYKSTIGSGTSYSYSHKLAESLDIKTAFKGTAETPLGGVEKRVSVDVNFHNNNSWGGLKTSDSETTSQTGLTLKLPPMDSNRGYVLYPTFYTTQDGTIKVAHAVDVLGHDTGKTFWAALYGRLPDPALNLPRRFSPVISDTSGVLVGWKPNTESSRKQMRGFFLEKPVPDPVSQTYELLASSPVAGDKVRIEARVYNYSTAVAASNLLVQFQLVGYNAGNDQETALSACPTDPTWQPGTRCLIGATTIDNLNKQEMKTAAITWDTTGFGPPSIGQAQYRVYVVLDPANTITETYETEDPNKQYACVDIQSVACTLPKGLDPGQNNEGFGYVTVKSPSPSTLEASSADITADVFLKEDSLAALNAAGRFRVRRVSAPVGQPLTLRATVYSDTLDTDIGQVLIYDGDPNQGADLIADKLIDTGNPEGASVRFDWIPTALGLHTLYAQVLERADDSHPGNNIQTLQVKVVPADDEAPKLGVILTPRFLWPDNDQFVPITAFLDVRDNQDPNPEITLESITANDTQDLTGDVQGAAYGTDCRAFQLRAKQTPRGRKGRVYTVTYSATDAAGNKTYAQAQVRVMPSK